MHLVTDILSFTDPTYTGGGYGSGTGGTGILWYVIFVIGLWATLARVGIPGWGAIIPIYNVYLILKLANRPGWWLILYIVPLVNIVVALIVAYDIARAFGRSGWFAFFGLFVFSSIGYLILGFSRNQYTEPVH